MQTKRISILQFLVVSLFLVAPFVMTYENIEMAALISARTLPSFVSSFAGWYRWVALGFLSLLGIFHLNKNQNLKITLPVYFISIFYFIQFLYALIDGVDYVRFLLMSLFSLIIPPVIGLAICRNKLIIKYFTYIIVLFLVISLVLNGHLVFLQERFFGFLSNPNTYGISTVFWLVILINAYDYKLITKKKFIIILLCLLFTMLLTGSRNAFVGMLLILVLRYYGQINKIKAEVFFVLFIFFVSNYFIDLTYVTNRLENIAESINDTGRGEIWDMASFAIDQNFWWGNGMDANLQILNTGNVHNIYIRYLLNMGMFFTIITLLMYFFSFVATFNEREKVPTIFTGYLIVFAIMNIGEDFFVGLGSSVYIYLLFIYGFINFYISSQNVTSR